MRLSFMTYRTDLLLNKHAIQVTVGKDNGLPEAIVATFVLQKRT